jgi:hypothetical protein
VLDAMVLHGTVLPLVLVGDRVACADGIDPDAVVAVAKAALDGPARP